MLIAFLENHLQADGTVTIPEAVSYTHLDVYKRQVLRCLYGRETGGHDCECSTWNITLIGTQLDQLDAFAEILVDYNQKVNLTAITDPEGIEDKHLSLIHISVFCRNLSLKWQL